MKNWSNAIRRVLIGLMVFNVVGVSFNVFLQWRYNALRQLSTLAVGDLFPSFSGVDIQGSAWVAQKRPCRVIRITDDQCPFCREDDASYRKIVEAARRASCEIIEIAPRAGGMADDARPGVVQLQYVDADIGSKLYPFVTPQTIILDDNWSVRMTRRGVFDDESMATSIAILGEVSAVQGASTL